MPSLSRVYGKPASRVIWRSVKGPVVVLPDGEEPRWQMRKCGRSNWRIPWCGSTCLNGVSLKSSQKERAYLEGALSWRKPLSCHLFPVRVRSAGRDYLHYDEIPECTGGRNRGVSEGVKLYVFLRDSLVRRFGQKWYEEFREHCEKGSSEGH
jgi:hypothetical protein